MCDQIRLLNYWSILYHLLGCYKIPCGWLAHWLHHDPKKEQRRDLILLLKRLVSLMIPVSEFSPNTTQAFYKRMVIIQNRNLDAKQILADEYKFIIMAGINNSKIHLMPGGTCINLAFQLQHYSGKKKRAPKID